MLKAFRVELNDDLFRSFLLLVHKSILLRITLKFQGFHEKGYTYSTIYQELVSFKIIHHLARIFHYFTKKILELQEFTRFHKSVQEFRLG